MGEERAACLASWPENLCDDNGEEEADDDDGKLAGLGEGERKFWLKKTKTSQKPSHPSRDNGTGRRRRTDGRTEEANFSSSSCSAELFRVSSGIPRSR